MRLYLSKEGILDATAEQQTEQKRYKDEFTYLAAYSIIKKLQAQGNANKDTLDRLNNWCAEQMGCMPIPL